MSFSRLIVSQPTALAPRSCHNTSVIFDSIRTLMGADGIPGLNGEAPRTGGRSHGQNAGHGHRRHRYRPPSSWHIDSGMVSRAKGSRDEGRGRSSRNSTRKGALMSSSPLYFFSDALIMPWSTPWICSYSGNALAASNAGMVYHKLVSTLPLRPATAVHLLFYIL